MQSESTDCPLFPWLYSVVDCESEEKGALVMPEVYGKASIKLGA
ncbi:hypothetical protein yberc0001_25690 [Yersinia bercovieri ATCC 43970]|uniref:Uncharacterized protein n=1 Tax=Yersinia bercovieri ATCC 43970 TaxID=349968 RepID=A0ABM9XYR8_YERBE|nr:hypothetical protein yberc0001_25690 [Yersinia bercovieri ATCC 43970]